MSRQEQSEAYRGFFGSDSGKKFLEHLDGMIDNAHDAADESDNEHVSYGHSKGAKAIKDVKLHIDTIMTPLRQGKSL